MVGFQIVDRDLRMVDERDELYWKSSISRKSNDEFKMRKRLRGGVGVYKTDKGWTQS